MENETNVTTNATVTNTNDTVSQNQVQGQGQTQPLVLKVSEAQNLVQTQVLAQTQAQTADPAPTSIQNQHTDNVELNLEDVFVNLRLISKINQGEKLLQYNKHINIDTSYLQLITRWFRGASRTESIGFIQKVLAKAFEFSDKLIEDKSEESAQKLLRLNTDLKNSLEGLTNLKITYMYDKLIQSEIDVMVDNIRSKLDLNSKHLNFTKSVSTSTSVPVFTNTVSGQASSSSNEKVDYKSDNKSDIKPSEKIDAKLENKSNEKHENKSNDKHKKNS